jgi:hypothetical protein
LNQAPRAAVCQVIANILEEVGRVLGDNAGGRLNSIGSDLRVLLLRCITRVEHLVAEYRSIGNAGGEQDRSQDAERRFRAGGRHGGFLRNE